MKSIAGRIALAFVLFLLAACSASVPENVALEGGCAAGTSPYLPRDLSVLESRISYCAEGDASTGTIRLSVPAASLADADLVIAGYPDHPGLTVSLQHGDGRPQVLAVPSAAESWVPLPLPEDVLDRPGFLTVTLEDRSGESYGWAGLGLALRKTDASAYAPAGAAAALLFLVILALELGRAAASNHPGSAATGYLRPGANGEFSWRRALGVAGTLAVLTVLALVFRRPSQFEHPYLWVEEGTISLPQFLEHGLAFLAEPVAGYLIVPSKLIFYVATFFPPEYFPAALLVLCIVFSWMAVCALALSPSYLGAPISVAAFMLLLPTDAENYGTAHYAFWLGSTLLIPAIFWKVAGRANLLPRTLLVVLGGLSSPLVVALAPAFLLRLAVLRTRDEIVQVATVLAVCGIQLYFLKASNTHGTVPTLDIDLAAIVEKFFGMFWSPTDELAMAFGVVLAVGVLVFVAFKARPSSPWPAIAGYCIGATILISITRVSVEMIHPVVAGPRYFFYPFIFLGLLVIEMGTRTRILSACCLVVMAFSMYRFHDVGSRTHDPISWEQQLRACAEADGIHPLPIHFDGNSTTPWHVRLPGSDCVRIRDGWK